MEIPVSLLDLAVMHPRLLWDDISAAVLGDAGMKTRLQLEVRGIPGFGSGILNMSIDPGGISEIHIAKLRRTYEPSRLVELAAIAIAGLGLYHAGGHEIRDVALRVSAADYLVDEANHLLEVAGRSRRSDFSFAWNQKWQWLSKEYDKGFYVCVVEFETPAGQLAFHI